jgi:hypothetical protein
MDGAKREVLIPATAIERPDVVIFCQNSLLDRSGFRAEGILPGDLPLGDYQVIAECRNAEIWDQFITPCRISVVSAGVVEPLDAPYERAAAEAAETAAKQAMQAQEASKKLEAKKSTGFQKDQDSKPKKKRRKQSQEGHKVAN